MAKLKQYQEKRIFETTPEPKPKIKKSSSNKLRFCVQKHAARSLHYDLRLELDGVLLSFAVPKGPSMDPAKKRLAIHVEDHPLDYINFTGVIPKGNYGAGTVEMWDQGNYIAEVKDMRSGLKKGHLRFVLEGKKLKGEFHLVKTKGQEQNTWLLFKAATANDASIDMPEAKGKKSAMPQFFTPMLAKLIDKPFDSDDWLFEIKWDGYRALAFINNTNVQLYSRNNISFNAGYPQIVKELKKMKIKAILDGEIVVLDDKGISRFELLQNCKANPDCNLHFMVFDLLYLNGYDLRSLPLIERKDILENLLSKMDLEYIHYSSYMETHGIDLFKEAENRGLEGLIAKEKHSTYVSQRSVTWLKIKTSMRQEFIVGGFTKPRGSRAYFGSLLLGVSSNEHLKFAGHVGTGFSEKMLQDAFKQIKPLIQKQCPFLETPKTNEPAIWLKPKLIAEVSFTEWTKQGILRHPVFHGFRIDKKPKQIYPEQKMTINEIPILSNLDKVFWPKEGYTKGDLLSYYEAIAPAILPHLAGRPLTLRRFPDGILGADFFQKNIEDPPDFLTTAIIRHTSKQAKKQDRQAVVNNLSSLLYIANLAAIEMHAMLARMDNLNHHDILVIDLDPEMLPFKKVVEVALMAHDLFLQINLPHYCKTSGGRGLHLYIPLGKNVTAEQAFNLSRLLAYIMRDQMPLDISLERLPKYRQKRIYVDYLQNSKGKNTVAPYSARALPHATVSTPLDWKEVNDQLNPLDFTIKTVPKRVEKLGDIFAPVLSESINLKSIIKKLEKFI